MRGTVEEWGKRKGLVCILNSTSLLYLFPLMDAYPVYMGLGDRIVP